MSSPTSLVLDTARREIGVREIGNTNRGRRVDEYQRADLLAGVGYAWCASFCAWVMLTTLGSELCDRVWLRSASCDSVLDWARRRDIDYAKPQPGDMGLVMNPLNQNDATHIFMVEKVGSKEITTVEGNTNDGGSRNGNGVYHRTRKLSSRYLYVRWPRLLPANPVPQGVVLVGTAPKSPLDGAQMWELWGDGGKRKMADVPILDGRARIPVWKWASWFGRDWEQKNSEPAYGWNDGAQTVNLFGNEIYKQPMIIESRSYLDIRTLVAATQGIAQKKLSLEVQPGKLILSQ